MTETAATCPSCPHAAHHHDDTGCAAVLWVAALMGAPQRRCRCSHPRHGSDSTPGTGDQSPGGEADVWRAEMLDAATALDLIARSGCDQAGNVTRVAGHLRRAASAVHASTPTGP